MTVDMGPAPNDVARDLIAANKIINQVPERAIVSVEGGPSLHVVRASYYVHDDVLMIVAKEIGK